MSDRLYYHSTCPLMSAKRGSMANRSLPRSTPGWQESWDFQQETSLQQKRPDWSRWEQPLPPDDCWVNSGFLLKSILIELEDPSIYFAHATYIPFATIKQIDIKYLPPITIMDITVNDDSSKKGPIDLSVTFGKPPTEVKFLVCQGRLPPMPVSHFLFIQVNPI